MVVKCREIFAERPVAVLSIDSSNKKIEKGFLQTVYSNCKERGSKHKKSGVLEMKNATFKNFTVNTRFIVTIK